MEKSYFVIVNSDKKGHYFPLIDGDEKIMMFETESCAIIAGNENFLGGEFGFEVFEIGGGIACLE